MVQIALSGIGAAVAWMTALLLLKYQRPTVLFHGLIVGGMCAAAECVLYFSGSQHLSEPISMAIFLLMTLAVALEKTGSHGNAVLAFFTARGAYCVFCFAAGSGGAWVAFGLHIIFAALAFRMRNSFPERDWRDYFSGPAPHDKKLDVRIWHVYGITALQCLICSLCAALI